MANDLVITEFQSEAEFYFLNRRELLTPQARILSFLPESDLFWKKNNIAYETQSAYFPKSSHEQCLLRVDEIIQEINRIAVIRDNSGIHNAYLNMLTFRLRPYLAYVIMSIETIHNSLQHHPVDRIHACLYSNNDHSQYELLPKERILGEIVRLFGGLATVEINHLKVPDELKRDPLKPLMRSLFSLSAFQLELHGAKKDKREVIAFYSLKYNLDQIAREFKDFQHDNIAPDRKVFTKITDDTMGIDVHNVHLPDLGRIDKVFSGSWQKTLDALRTAGNLFSYRGIDFSGLMLRKIEQGFTPEMEGFNQQIAALKTYLKVRKPRLALAPMSRGLSYALGELCSQMDIPSALISHGSHVPPQNRFDYIEWFDHGKGMVHTDYRYHLLQSPWAVEHVRAMGYQGRYYCIEPFIFPTVDRTNKEEKQAQMLPQTKGKKIIMHAGTPKPRGANRLYIYETLDEYIENLRDLVEAVRGMSDAFLIIRFRPNTYLSVAQLKALLPPGDHYTVSSEGAFADYLRIADLVVSFSSTTIEEALINNIPVLQYDPTDRYVHIDGARWADKGFAHVDSVYYIGDRACLRPGLEWIIRSHLNATTVGDLFERHTFDQDEAVRVEEFIERLFANDLPEPVHVKEKTHVHKELY